LDDPQYKKDKAVIEDVKVHKEKAKALLNHDKIEQKESIQQRLA